jgi:hypothetical protein
MKIHLVRIGLWTLRWSLLMVLLLSHCLTALSEQHPDCPCSHASFLLASPTAQLGDPSGWQIHRSSSSTPLRL